MHGLGLETGIDNLRVAAPDARPGHRFISGGGLVRGGRRRRAFLQTARRRARAGARAAPRLDFGDGPRGQAREGEAVLWVLRGLRPPSLVRSRFEASPALFAPLFLGVF